MRILDRLPATGRKLTAEEKAAVDALNAKYANVPFKAMPARHLILKKKRDVQAE
jgi:hypothetical protein